eukprot:scaffold155178_cov29-Tisochrysis_lutea.AAC.3
MQRREVDVSIVRASKENDALLWVVETQQQVDDGRLAATGLANQRGDRARRHGEADTFENGVGRTHLVSAKSEGGRQAIRSVRGGVSAGLHFRGKRDT